MMIDMHAHWRPAEVADALRARTREPRIVRNDAGVEVMKFDGWKRLNAEYATQFGMEAPVR